MKACTKCGEEYPLEHFNKKGSGRSTRCKKCVAEYFRDYYHNNPQRKTAHKARVAANKKKRPHAEQARKYKITEEKVAELISANNGICVICNINKATDIDHCHKTNEVRGALCGQCNRALGLFRDNPEILQSAANYLWAVYPLSDKE